MRIRNHNPRLLLLFRKWSRVICQFGTVSPDLRDIWTLLTLCLVPWRAVNRRQLPEEIVSVAQAVEGPY